VASLTAELGSPHWLEIGIRDDAPVFLDLATVSTLNLAGPGVDEVIRAWCASFIAAGSPGTAEILTTAPMAATLFPGLHPTTALRTADNPESLLRSLEAEIVGRSRQLDDADVSDAASYRAARPEDPLPSLFAIVDEVSEKTMTRWQGVFRLAGRLDIVVIILGHDTLVPAQIIIDLDHCVTSASPGELDARLRGAKLFGLNGNEAAELIGTVIAAHDDKFAEAETDLPVPDPSPTQTQEDRAQAWPLEPVNPKVGTGKPVQVRLLGPYQIIADGQEITKGLRTAGKELLAWYLLRPEGASAEAAVDALWPDTSPELVTKRFWRALGDLRSHLRHEDSNERYEVLIRSGDHYHPQREQIACDLWEFQDYLSQAARASSDDEALDALRKAVDVYQGDFVSDVDYLWIETVREDLHRRALDAHLRLAELEEVCENPDAALDVLSRSVDLDCYAEEVYRRLMALQARIGRPDSIAATWHQLQRNLAVLEVDPEPATVRLFQDLSHRDDLADAVGPVRR
jgi:DNA-binding SARP family transcriptional activator